MLGIVLGGVLGLAVLLLACGYYSFYLTTMVKRRTDEELYQLYPGTADFYQRTAKTAKRIMSHDGLQLYGELYQQSQEVKADQLVILVHGYKNNRLASMQYIPMFWQLGYDVFVVDQRSHGKSEGKIATYGNCEKQDLLAWINQLQSEYHRIGLHGHSMGGATVLAVAQYEKLAFIISEAGLTQAAQGVQTYVQNRLHLPNWAGKIMIALTNIFTILLGKFSLYRTNPGSVASQSAVPILAIHGTADESVPVWMSEQLIADKIGEYNQLWRIDGGTHKDLYQKQPGEYNRIIETFLQQISK